MRLVSAIALSLTLSASAFAQGYPIPNHNVQPGHQLPQQPSGCPQQGSTQPAYQAAPQDQFTSGLTSLLGAAKGLMQKR